VTGRGTYIDVARKLIDENAKAIRAVYESVLSDPRTTARQRARAAARIRQLDQGSSAEIAAERQPRTSG
jgi:hypothetical protein